MKLVIDIPEDTYNAIQENYYCGILNSDMYNAIKNGQPLPDDCEILTKEAYADLCFSASKGG